MSKLFEEENKTSNSVEIPAFINTRRRVKRVKNNFFRQFLTCLLCVLIACFVLYRAEIVEFSKSILTKNSSLSGKNKWDFTLPFSAKSKNILLMGVDVSDNSDKPFEGVRSDSIYLVNIAPYAKGINVISIPRDSKVYIHSKSSPDKINHAFAYGGIDLSIKTIEETLGVRIDNYFVLSNLALVEFIEKIGGLDIYIEKDMYYNDNTAKLHIDLKKGVQHLNGKQAEGYLRYRKDALGDIGRIRRQQWFFNALSKKLKESETLIKVPDAIKAVSKYIQTDLSLYEIAQYASLAKTIDSSQMQVATLPGEPSQRGAISYWILDPKGVQDMINRLVYHEKPKALDRALEIGILYSPNEEDKAAELKNTLENAGFKVNIRSIKTLGHSHIAIHNADIPNDYLLNLKNDIPVLKEFQTVYDTIGIYKAGKDITIILQGS